MADDYTFAIVAGIFYGGSIAVAYTLGYHRALDVAGRRLAKVTDEALARLQRVLDGHHKAP